MVTFSDGWDHRNDRRLSQKSYPAFIPLIDWIFGLDAAEPYIYIIYIYKKQQQQQQKCSRVWAIFFKKRKSVLPSSARDTTPKNREKKADSKHEVPTPIKIRNYVWLACETRAKIALSEPDTSLTTTLLLSLRRPRWLYGNHQSSQFVSKFLETTGAIGTIIWKPGFNNTGIQIKPGKSYIWWHSSEICGLTSLERRATIKSLNTDVEII